MNADEGSHMSDKAMEGVSHSEELTGTVEEVKKEVEKGGRDGVVEGDTE